MITGARNTLTISPVEVGRGGILAVSTVVDSTDPHDLLGVQAETDACAEAYTWTEFCTQAGVQCPSYVPPSTGLKTFDDAPELIVGDPIVIYAGVECDFQNLAESKARAERRLGYAERRLVDFALTEWLDDNAVAAVGSGGPFGIAEGIGILENYAANVYGGTPLLVMPIPVVACGCECVMANLDGTAASRQGTPIANVVTLDTEPYTVYVTGRIALVRGPVQSYSVPSQNLCDGDVSPPRALAERIYVPLIECLAAKVEVTCP